MQVVNLNPFLNSLDLKGSSYSSFFFNILSVQATKHLDLQGDAHDFHKTIKTEPRPERGSDISGSHEMKTSVIRIPQEYG